MICIKIFEIDGFAVVSNKTKSSNQNKRVHIEAY